MSATPSSVVDVHCHVVPERFPPYAGKGRDVPWPSMADAHACHKHVMISGKAYRTVSDGCWSVPRRVADMDAMRIERQALSPMPELLSYWLPAEDAAALLRYINDQIAEMAAAAPGRFVGLAGVPLQDMDLALRELERAVKQLGFAGVELASHVNGVSIGDARFAPFFAEAERLVLQSRERCRHRRCSGAQPGPEPGRRPRGRGSLGRAAASRRPQPARSQEPSAAAEPGDRRARCAGRQAALTGM